MSGTYHRIVNTPRTILEAVAARLLREEEIAQAIRDAEGEALPAAEDIDTSVLDDLTPDEVSQLLLDAATKGQHSYAELRGFDPDARPVRQVDGDVPEEAKRPLDYGGLGRGSDL